MADATGEPGTGLISRPESLPHRAGRNRRTRSFSFRLPVAAALVGVALLATACDDDGSSPPSPTATAPSSALTALPTPAGTAPGGGGIRVVEQGFSPTKDSSGKDMVSYGLVVENTSRDQVAVKTRATVRLTDGSGKAITDLVAGGTDVEREIGVVFPGQRVGIGMDTYVDRADVVQLSITIGAATWLPPGNTVQSVAKATASDVKTERSGSGGPATLTFTVTSEYRQVLDDPSAQAVFRDSAGKIVGGTGPALTGPRDQYRPGRSTGQIDAKYGVPPNADDSRTEVYLSPFCC